MMRKLTLVVGDGDLVFTSGGLLTGRDVQDTVGIDVEGDLDLWHAAGCGWDAGQLELSEQIVVLGHGTLSLVDLDQYTGLVVGVGGEGLSGLGGDGGVTLDEGGHHTASGLDTEGQRGDVEEQQVLDLLRLVTVEDGSLYGSTVSNSLIRVDALVQLLQKTKMDLRINSSKT